MRSKALSALSSLARTVAATCIYVPATLGAQDTAAAEQRGELVERIVSAADSTQSYALFLPAGYYTTRQRWPLLLVLDPRGRALLPLRRLLSVANDRGYVVMSSYNSLSDGPIEPNISAMNAMIADAQRSLAIEERRLYIAAFSGTARLAWSFARDLGEHAAGIIGFGAGVGRPALGSDSAWRQLAFFGGSGRQDFNYDELVAMDFLLDTLDVPHRMTYFSGRHEWPPDSVLSIGVEWLDLQAMRRGLLRYDSTWVERLARRRLAAAQALESSGPIVDALAAYRGVGEDFPDLETAREARQRQAALTARPDVQRALDRRGELVHASARYRALVDLAVGALNARQKRPTARELAQLLKIDSLKKEAARTAGDESDAAQRLLEFAFVIGSFYQPRYYIERRDGERALIILELAAMIDEHHPRLCVQRALAWAVQARAEEAARELECARRAGVLTAELLADRTFDRVRRSAAFRAVANVEAGRGSH